MATKSEKVGLDPPGAPLSGPPATHRPGGSPSLPSYEEDILARLQHLNLEPSKSKNTRPALVIAHLKLLHAIHQLRQDVATNDSLLDISPYSGPKADSDDPEVIKCKAQVREKRWQVFVSKAVDRFEKWWTRCVPATLQGKRRDPLTIDQVVRSYPLSDEIISGGRLSNYLSSRLPPLDVIMVWHAYMLNPRCFFEDCLRHGKIDFWTTGMPWELVDQHIDPITFEFNVSDEHKAMFTEATGEPWDSLSDINEGKHLTCPNCRKQARIPWTYGAGWVDNNTNFAPGCGYADAEFAHYCEQCKQLINNEYLRLQKFRGDLQSLLKDDAPLPGTILSIDGKPVNLHVITVNNRGTATKANPKSAPTARKGLDSLFPSFLARGQLRTQLLSIVMPDKTGASVDEIKNAFEYGIRNSVMVELARVEPLAGYPGMGGKRPANPIEKSAVRRMMSRYWYNHSPFALDLVGAVVRQGTFIDKMVRIDWLHSPALEKTVERLIIKYGRFFEIMGQHPKHMAVPTLDVDLAWHTHQLDPPNYYRSSILATNKFIDHDDKIEEVKLSEAFEWTSKTYQDRYSEVYSECTCWYCEAVRESHTSATDKLFNRGRSKALETFHGTKKGESGLAVTADQCEGAHISAHNVVRTSNPNEKVRIATHQRQLEALHQKALNRARKKGYSVPRREDYRTYDTWGYPIGYPVYYPFYVDPYFVGGGYVYASDPCYVNTGGGYGNCAAGSCGGMAAAGGAACAGVSNGSCAGVGAGGCGGGGAAAGGCGGSGGCGGGGGGCGGGGGGCGGGGGGGCGGGG